MADLLIRDVPDEVIAAIDATARRLGLSRTQYLRRQLSSQAATSAARVTPEDLTAFSETFADLEDPDIMDAAWR